ncbi:DUF6745 domain-containing protein [Micromonospora sp. LOL_021]|uniref:DUF6745 domain-containing protein n=1 Tax=Micromonospora sp. LOL_021 TaxID=3345417 RepID=UPI003A8A75C2
MTAPTRRDAARSTSPAPSSDRAVAYWQLAEPVRREWLDHGLDTAPADRATTEDVLSRIYARHYRSRPRFRWVDSPRQALPLLAGLPTHDLLQQWIRARQPAGKPPLASDIAAGLSRLRSALDAGADHPDLTPAEAGRKKHAGNRDARKKDTGKKQGGAGPKWPVLPPTEALAAGVPLRVVLQQGVRDALRTSLVDGFSLPVRGALAAVGRQPVPTAWYGQQDAHWVAYYDVLRRLGLARYRRADETQLEEWAALARSAGWWWPGERTCVLVERPAVIRTEPVSGAWHGEQRPASGLAGPVGYRDGWRPLG